MNPFKPIAVYSVLSVGKVILFNFLCDFNKAVHDC